MPKEAGQFVTELSQDPEKLEKFLADPDAAMADVEGLSDEAKAVLRSKDPDKIKDFVGLWGPPGCLLVV